MYALYVYRRNDSGVILIGTYRNNTFDIDLEMSNQYFGVTYNRVGNMNFGSVYYPLSISMSCPNL